MRSRLLRSLAVAVLAAFAVGAALFIDFNVLLALGFWLNPSTQPEEEEDSAPQVTLHVTP